MSDLTFPIAEPQTEAEYKAIIEQMSREMDVMLRQIDETRAETLRIRAQSHASKQRTNLLMADIEERAKRLWGKQ